MLEDYAIIYNTNYYSLAVLSGVLVHFMFCGQFGSIARARVVRKKKQLFSPEQIYVKNITVGGCQFASDYKFVFINERHGMFFVVKFNVMEHPNA